MAVKVLDGDGEGSTSGVIAGINFGQYCPFSCQAFSIYREIVATNATARGLSGKAVMNMSLGGSKSNALNSAIAAVTRAGVTAVVAAGNENVSSDKNLSSGQADGSF